jgi:hypothetical protein
LSKSKQSLKVRVTGINKRKKAGPVKWAIVFDGLNVTEPFIFSDAKIAECSSAIFDTEEEAEAAHRLITKYQAYLSRAIQGD